MMRASWAPRVSGFDDDFADELGGGYSTPAVDIPPPPEVDFDAMSAPGVGGAAPSKLQEDDSPIGKAIDATVMRKLEASPDAAPIDQPTVGRPPPMPMSATAGTDDARLEREDIDKAAERDNMARIMRGLETAGHQLTAGVLGGPVATTVSPETNYEGVARARADKGEEKRYQRSQAEIAAAHQRAMSERQARLDKLEREDKAEAKVRLARLDDVKQHKDESDADFRERQLKSQEKRAREHDAAIIAAAGKAAATASGKAEKEAIKGMPAGWELTGEALPDDKQKRDFEGLVSSSGKMHGLTSKLRSLLSQTSGVEKYLPGDKANALKQVATQIMLEAKNVADLGAISGPDMALIEAISADPTQLKNVFKDVGALSAGLDEWAKNSVDSKAQSIGAIRKTGSNVVGGSSAAGGQVYENDKGEKIRWNGSAWEPVK